MLKSSKLLSRFFVIIFLTCMLTGCSMIKNYQKSQEQKKLDTELKKNNYMSLKRDIATNALRNGILAEELKAKYGLPDDVFYSSSSVSSFQIWTYDSTRGKLDDTALSPIILYLENDKLVNWKY